MIHATIRMVIPPNKRSEAQRILTSVLERTRLIRGCLGCSLYQGMDDRNVVMIDQLWQTGEDLEGHLRSEDYLKILLVVEMAAKKPAIRFDRISESTGVDWIEKARSNLFRSLNNNQE
jgi:quinol monooxygenase YgiN